MSARKGRVEKASATDDGVAMILEYLRKQNRPYSAVEISANLHNKVTKVTAAKVLRELHQNEKIEGRVSGKQTVYHALQAPDDDATPEAIAALDNDIKILQDQLTGLKASEKKARAELATLNAKPLLSEIQKDIGQLELEKEEITTNLARLRRSNPTQVSLEERTKIEREWKIWQRHVNVRRRICRELWGRCSDVLPEDMTREELWESLGLEGAFK